MKLFRALRFQVRLVHHQRQKLQKALQLGSVAVQKHNPQRVAFHPYRRLEGIRGLVVHLLELTGPDFAGHRRQLDPELNRFPIVFNRNQRIRVYFFQ